MAQISREHKTLRSGETQRRRTFAKKINFEILPDESAYHRPLPVPATGHFSRPSSRVHESGNYSRSSVNSHSEPQLNKLFKTTRLPTRLRSKDTGLLAASPVLQEVHEDESDTRTTDEPLTVRDGSNTNLTMGHRMPTTRFSSVMAQTKAESARRASVPVEFDAAFTTPKWSIEDTDASTETNETFPVADSALTCCITTDDLTKLSLLLPTHLADYLREELIKSAQRRTIPQPSGGLFQFSRQPAEHLGLCPLTQATNSDHSRHSSQTHNESVTMDDAAGSITCADAACQVDGLLIPSSVTQWPLRSHSASLFLPIGEYKIDHVYLSANDYQNALHNAAYPDDLEHVALSDRLTCAIDLGDGVFELAPSAELSNGADTEFATPSTMMSSSFHSTRTNLSNRSEAAANWLHAPSADEMNQSSSRPDELGATPTTGKDHWLARRRARCDSSSVERQGKFTPFRLHVMLVVFSKFAVI
ncbi:unnamed protein product [Echinostoma caproni]|uniref:Uncharacterized protein n=1 Tax=Echinostoma caproni TaxID=27848 RepID=A0A3P8GBQ5_9TREM|nr:unnamed protein product [Echinostoma caproni]